MSGNINVVNMNMDGGDGLYNGAKPVINGLRFINSQKKNRSITSLSKDLIMQFPVLMSADIAEDHAVTIAKSLERMYAAMYLSVWTADSAFGVDASLNGVRDFVKRYHNNDDIPDMITYGGNLLSLADGLIGNRESVISSMVMTSENTGVPANEMYRLWDSVTDRINTESINDLYQPSKNMIDKINDITDNIIEPATEAKGGRNTQRQNQRNSYSSTYVQNLRQENKNLQAQVNTANRAANDAKKKAQKYREDFDGAARTYKERKKYEEYEANARRAVNKLMNRQGAKVNSKNSDWGSGSQTVDDIGKTAFDDMLNSSHNNNGYNDSQVVNYFDNTRNAIVRNDKITSMEPTLIDVTFLVHGGDFGNSYTFDPKTRQRSDVSSVGLKQVHAIIGVKTMVRLISSEYMKPNVIASIQDQSFAFKFIKWTKGELKIWKDMIFGISRMKADAMAGTKADKWFAALRKRGRNAKAFRFTETGLSPFTTLVLTSDEVEQIRISSGFDIRRRDVCKMLMDNLYLLGLIIVNTATGTVETIFDGFQDFSTTTLGAMRESASKSNDLINPDALREVKQIMGRF